jgi:dTDP-4-amino-4,6-dideoxygalactose transaminase
VSLPPIDLPFNRPYATGKEFEYIREAIAAAHLSGDGQFTRRCHRWLCAQTGAAAALLTHSCTAALELSALVGRLGPGDEVIMPSYTFVSTANAFALRGATPVFVDVRADTVNLDETLIEAAITPRTRALCVVHYAGVGCAMDAIMAIARRHRLLVIEDAAQGCMASYRGQALGTFGELGCLSFHETKNVISGEGGALLINDPELRSAAEIAREKGTNRSAFYRGEVDKYTWVDLGSSFLPSEILAAFLWAQFEHAREITDRRQRLWDSYHQAFAAAEQAGLLRRPVIPADCRHNAHMYYLLLRDLEQRSAVMRRLRERGILAVFHYVPLHSSPAGLRFGRSAAALPVTEDIADRLLRLPLWLGLEDAQIEQIAETVLAAVDPRA